jgi:hypothetical protein
VISKTGLGQSWPCNPLDFEAGVAKTYEVGDAEKVDESFEKLVARQVFVLLKIDCGFSFTWQPSC